MSRRHRPPGCSTSGAHELGHVRGFIHEQDRNDGSGCQPGTVDQTATKLTSFGPYGDAVVGESLRAADGARSRRNQCRAGSIRPFGQRRSG